LASLAIPGCVADTGSDETTESGEAVQAVTEPAATTEPVAATDDTPIPPELSFGQLSDSIQPRSCGVKFIYCRDPIFHAPTWCYTGSCLYLTALKEAKALCPQICGHVCSVIYNEACP